MRATASRLLASLAVVAALGPPARADSWNLPKTMVVASKDETYRLTVEPASGSGPARRATRGKLERKVGADRREVVWDHALSNDESPVTALVAHDGTVVTFDNWHRVGYGSNVVVIYAPDGKLVRAMGLDTFLTPEEIAALPHSVSSIWWGRNHRLADDQQTLLMNVGNGWGEPKPTKTICLRLKTGELLPSEAPEGTSE